MFDSKSEWTGVGCIINCEYDNDYIEIMISRILREYEINKAIATSGR